MLARGLSLPARVLAVDAPFFDIRDGDGLKAEIGRSQALGFASKTAIHPFQIAPINTALTPTPEAIARARAILSENKKGVGVVDGQMIDEAVARQARRILTAAGGHEHAVPRPAWSPRAAARDRGSQRHRQPLHIRVRIDWEKQGYEGVVESTIKKYNAMIHTQSAVHCMVELATRNKLDSRKVTSIEADSPAAGSTAWTDSSKPKNKRIIACRTCSPWPSLTAT
jgi:hypothetical protein